MKRSILVQRLMAAFLAFGWSGGIASAQQVPQRTATEKDIQDVLKLVDRMSGPDAVDAERAELDIERLAWFDVPVVKEQAKRGDLTPAAKSALVKALSRLEPRTRWFLKVHQRTIMVTTYLHQLVSDDAKRHAKGGAPWLGAVEKSIDLANQELHAETLNYQMTIRGQERQQVDAAIAGGCDDPAFLAMYGLFLADSGASADKVYSVFKQGRDKAKGVDVAPYMLFVIDRRVLTGMADGRDGGTLPQNPAAGPIIEEMVHSMCKALDDKATPDQMKISGSIALLDTALKLHLQIVPLYDAVFASLEKQLPNDAQVLALKGRYYKEMAWEARGGGWGKDVTDKGWKDFAARLDIAASTLAKSYDLDPEDPTAATQMITVVMGQDGDAATVEKWFKRAMAANPDNLEACNAKMYYLEPKWHGDPEAMLEFGHQAFDDGNWVKPEIPLMLVDAHYRLAAYEANPDQYFQRPGVWDDIHACYAKALEVTPNATGLRSVYCRYACYCHQWKEADAQFKILGDKIVPAAFRNTQEMEEYRRQAAEAAANP